MSTPWARIDLTHELRGLVSRPGREREQVKERVDPNDKIGREREEKNLKDKRDEKDSQREREKMPGLPSIVFLSVPLPALSRR